MTNPEFLEWLAARLVKVYGESENVDFVLKLREIAWRELPTLERERNEARAEVRALEIIREQGHADYRIQNSAIADLHDRVAALEAALRAKAAEWRRHAADNLDGPPSDDPMWHRDAACAAHLHACADEIDALLGAAPVQPAPATKATWCPAPEIESFAVMPGVQQPVAAQPDPTNNEVTS